MATLMPLICHFIPRVTLTLICCFQIYWEDVYSINSDVELSWGALMDETFITSEKGMNCIFQKASQLFSHVTQSSSDGFKSNQDSNSHLSTVKLIKWCPPLNDHQDCLAFWKLNTLMYLALVMQKKAEMSFVSGSNIPVQIPAEICSFQLTPVSCRVCCCKTLNTFVKQTLQGRNSVNKARLFENVGERTTKASCTL